VVNQPGSQSACTKPAAAPASGHLRHRQRGDELERLLDGVAAAESASTDMIGAPHRASADDASRPAPISPTVLASCCTFCARVDVTYTDGGVEDTFAPELVRTDQVTIVEAGAAAHIGEMVIHFANDPYITPGEGRKLAEAFCGVGRLRRRPPMSTRQDLAPVANATPSPSLVPDTGDDQARAVATATPADGRPT
jgi:hypothetical protein